MLTVAGCWLGGLGMSVHAAELDQRVAYEVDRYGAIYCGDRTAKRLALIFTGDQFGEGAPVILDALATRKIRASFFLTGRFLRDPELRPSVEQMIGEGHYVGPHSDGHLLYCDWDDRDKSLVTESTFRTDLKKNLAELRKLGAPPTGAPLYFVPPFEWYNRDQVQWARRLGVLMVNFTPGSGSNRDYVREGDKRFVPSATILADILAFEREQPAGLNGFLLLMHVGSGRRDPLHAHVGKLCDELGGRGYELVRIDELL